MFKKFLAIIFIFSFLAPMHFVSARVIIPYSTVSGYVKSNGAPIANATVSILFPGDSEIINTAVTDNDGFYSLK